MYLTPALNFERIMTVKETGLPAQQRRQAQSHNLINRVKEKIRS